MYEKGTLLKESKKKLALKESISNGMGNSIFASIPVLFICGFQ
jgi:hypothetical protein